mmetsp:Transcript_43476/g.103598  ORF Transcript_43476/g.103598 Transcript_43476/m.103598 type:complete len:459 (+) Transcript_43476:589-1965(+)
MSIHLCSNDLVLLMVEIKDLLRGVPKVFVDGRVLRVHGTDDLLAIGVHGINISLGIGVHSLLQLLSLMAGFVFDVREAHENLRDVVVKEGLHLREYVVIHRANGTQNLLVTSLHCVFHASEIAVNFGHGVLQWVAVSEVALNEALVAVVLCNLERIQGATLCVGTYGFTNVADFVLGAGIGSYGSSQGYDPNNGRANGLVSWLEGVLEVICCHVSLPLPIRHLPASIDVTGAAVPNCISGQARKGWIGLGPYVWLLPIRVLLSWYPVFSPSFHCRSASAVHSESMIASTHNVFLLLLIAEVVLALNRLSTSDLFPTLTCQAVRSVAHRLWRPVQDGLCDAAPLQLLPLAFERLELRLLKLCHLKLGLRDLWQLLELFIAQAAVASGPGFGPLPLTQKALVHLITPDLHCPISRKGGGHWLQRRVIHTLLQPRTQLQRMCSDRRGAQRCKRLRLQAPRA